MKASSLSLAALLALTAATSAFAADNYGERSEEAPRRRIVVSQRPAMM